MNGNRCELNIYFKTLKKWHTKQTYERNIAWDLRQYDQEFRTEVAH